jgi:hypothetical protein
MEGIIRIFRHDSTTLIIVEAKEKRVSVQEVGWKSREIKAIPALSPRHAPLLTFLAIISCF